MMTLVATGVEKRKRCRKCLEIFEVYKHSRSRTREVMHLLLRTECTWEVAACQASKLSRIIGITLSLRSTIPSKVLKRAIPIILELNALLVKHSTRLSRNKPK